MTRSANFWERRRAGVKAEVEASAAAEQAAIEARQQQALAEKSAEEILADLDLPDPETMKKGDDFTAFMAKAVPEHIRKRALRKLWRSNPVLACVDGLNDYDDDYLTGSYGNGPIATNYQVGKGLLAHVLEVAQQGEQSADDAMTLDKDAKAAQDKPQEEPVEIALTDEAAVATGEAHASDLAAEPEASVQDADDGADDFRPRRMAFYFDGNSA